MNLDNVIATGPAKKVYRDGDLCIKVFDESFSKSDILNEAVNHARVEETGLNVPKLKEVTQIDGKWAIVTQFIEGKTLKKLIEENPSKKEEYFNMFVDLQLEMHSKKAPNLNKLKDKMNRKISESNLDATTKYELHSRLGGMPKHDKVCHGDYNLSNVILKDDGTAYIIDWAHATQGNASADAARTYLLFSLADDIEDAKMYLDIFAKKSDTAKQYIQKWMPIVAASRLVKGNDEEKEILLRWIDVIEPQ